MIYESIEKLIGADKEVGEAVKAVGEITDNTINIIYSWNSA